MAKKQVMQEIGDKAVRLYLPPEAHARLRVLAAAAGVPMSRFTRQLVLEKISEKNRK